MQFKLIYCILMTFLPPLRGSLLIILRFTGAALAPTGLACPRMYSSAASPLACQCRKPAKVVTPIIA